tara:strand:- start:697 stop:852 length:156 start_codon:yes stop_codon:yes gene_type:complete
MIIKNKKEYDDFYMPTNKNKPTKFKIHHIFLNISSRILEKIIKPLYKNTFK